MAAILLLSLFSSLICLAAAQSGVWTLLPSPLARTGHCAVHDVANARMLIWGSAADVLVYDLVCELSQSRLLDIVLPDLALTGTVTCVMFRLVDPGLRCPQSARLRPQHFHCIHAF